MAYIKELKVTYQRKRVDDDLLKKPVESSEQVYQLFKDMEDEAREKVVCLHLNPQLEILSYELVGMGSADGVLLDVAGIFRGILLSAAHSFIIVHNHPSGNSKPSKEDEKASKELIKWGKGHRIPMQDFVIIGEDGYYSFEERGKLKK